MAELAQCAAESELLARLLASAGPLAPAGGTWAELYWALLRAGFTDDALIKKVQEAARLEEHV